MKNKYIFIAINIYINKNQGMHCCCSVTQSCPMNCSTPGFPVFHYRLEFAQTHVHWVNDAIQPSHPLLPPSFAFNLSQHQGLFQRVGSSHQVAKVLELQPQHQSFQRILRLIPLGLIGLISLLSRGLSRVFSSTTTESISSSVFSLLYDPTLIHTWLLEKP